MRTFFIIIFSFYSFILLAQDQQIAYEYFRKGEYEKSATIYQNLFENNPYNSYYLSRLIDCKQQLEEFEKVEELIKNRLKKFPSQSQYLVELGYNFQLQYKNDEAKKYYNKALKQLEKNKYAAYSIAKAFQENYLLDYALQAYKKASQLNPDSNYTFQIASIYGEKGDMNNMFDTYLNTIEADEKYVKTILRYIGKYITDDSENENNQLFKNLVLKRLQKKPKNAWNQLLSWLFIQQKDYFKAFIQERALYNRSQQSLEKIAELGEISFQNNDFEASKKIFEYLYNESRHQFEKILAQKYLLEIAIKTSKDISAIDKKFEEVFSKYGKSTITIEIQVLYANFLTFNKNNPSKAISSLKNTLKLPVNKFQKGMIKLKLGDILVFNNKFNEALINFSQVQTSLKNHILGQQARYKVAQTSYFKGDFDWAETQLKVLKGSTSQLIANDALDLSLIIADNSAQDSLKTALKLYAKADLLAYQNKNNDAITMLNKILENHKGHAIEDEALMKQASIFEKINEFDNAEINYLKIIGLKANDILVDDAYYKLAELHSKQNNIEKVKEYYQKIIFDFPSSIHLVDARKKYRKLRGDLIN